MHPSSVNAALSAFTSTSLPSYRHHRPKTARGALAKWHNGGTLSRLWSEAAAPGGQKKREKPERSGSESLFKRGSGRAWALSMIGPCRPAPRLIRWLDCNFVKGTSCFLWRLNISVQMRFRMPEGSRLEGSRLNRAPRERESRGNGG